MPDNTEVDTLKTVMDKTAVLIEQVRPEQLHAPTPCTEWDVERLLKHLVGWAGNFAARAEGAEPEQDPDSIELGNDPAGQFRSAAARLVKALSADTDLPENAPQAPILLAEYVAHGSDLAAAIGQPSPFTDAEAEPGLTSMRDMLKPEYRGHGFENEVEAPADASTVQKLLAFSGRPI